MAVAFCACAVVGAALVLAARRKVAAQFFSAFAITGILWWLVRGVGTLAADFSVGFKIVHTVLALVTIGLGLLVLRASTLSFEPTNRATLERGP